LILPIGGKKSPERSRIGYHLVGNMLRVCRGDRYSMMPFVTKTGDALIYPVQ